MDLVRQIENQWKTNQLVTKGDHIIAGVSGGADSVCLLAVLCQLSEKWQLTVTAVHVNHCIRQETALRDAAFVEEFCRRRKVECHVIKTDVPRIARENGLSLETAGRMERYRIFEEIRVQYGAQSIAVAHHMDDNAETILFQLLRGSGLKGLGGMGIRRGAVIRPLLFLSRNQIEEWVEEFRREPGFVRAPFEYEDAALREYYDPELGHFKPTQEPDAVIRRWRRTGYWIKKNKEQEKEECIQ